VIRRANDTEYGLVALISTTKDLKPRMRCVGTRIYGHDRGLNRGLCPHPAAPFGGSKGKSRHRRWRAPMRA